MVSQYTWPNFKGGPDRDGVRILIQQQNFDEDVVYGKTKIFIRSPQTLFMLEQARHSFPPLTCQPLTGVLLGESKTDTRHSHFPAKTVERHHLPASISPTVGCQADNGRLSTLQDALLFEVAQQFVEVLSACIKHGHVSSHCCLKECEAAARFRNVNPMADAAASHRQDHQQISRCLQPLASLDGRPSDPQSRLATVAPQGKRFSRNRRSGYSLLFADRSFGRSTRPTVWLRFESTLGG